ncbi:glutathione-disulfide reductase [Pokkaliibacter sp. MBI-7]|uniref:glutathione-disulfide reductase n=1 Tax=Pokkaliibacter sp. MBI-7 TaxID=3040600 RepID=UPI00244A60CB|nr:glutathione-disulfide reductase [Pokkaliibacter sp. MBI-7]MDH2435182.1 glutathione-disulfide reductase [Pokkaliibacter sp. MBI-7]
MSQYDFDLFVIGAGSGGVRASRMAAGLGARVAVCEDRYMGGTCVNVGCVPKKLYSYAAHYGHDFHDAAGFGWELEQPRFNWATLRDNKKSEISRLNGIYRNMLGNAGVELIDGRGTLVDEHTVRVGDKTYTSERILVATGGWPFIPDIPGRELAVSSNEIFDLARFPQRIVIVGGGYIAVEFASIFAGLGAETHLLYRGELFLRGFDQEIREYVATEMAKKGVRLHFNTDVTELSQTSLGIQVSTGNGPALHADQVLYATGRVANTQGLGLEAAGVALDNKGAVKVNNRFQTSVPSIYALGDVIDRVQLTPVALAEGTFLANHLYGEGRPEPDYDNIPTAVFCHPNIGTVGLSEEQARERYGNIKVFRSEFRPLRHTLSGSDERCLMKLIVDSATDKVVGVHMAGAEAGEIIQGIGIALKAGATKAVFDATIGIHPTAAEEFVTMRTPAR